LIQVAGKAFVAFVSPAQQSCAALGFVLFVIELTHCKLTRMFIMLLTITFSPYFREKVAVCKPRGKS